VKLNITGTLKHKTNNWQRWNYDCEPNKRPLLCLTATQIIINFRQFSLPTHVYCTASYKHD